MNPFIRNFLSVTRRYKKVTSLRVLGLSAAQTAFMVIMLQAFTSCQTRYEVGVSSVSIEPTEETVSLTLAGYASPSLGRFTLTWEEANDMPDGISVKQSKEAFQGLEGKPIGKDKTIISLTDDSHHLYALTSNGWLMQRPLNQNDAEWLRIGYNNGDTYVMDIKQIVYSKGKLYALSSEGRWYRSCHSKSGDLSARAMAIRKGKSVVVITGVDVCGFDYSFTESIKTEISRQRDIPTEAILINASHTHYAPVTQKWSTWPQQNRLPDSLYLNNIVRKGIIKAIEEALDRMEPAYLYFGRDTTDIGFNRRFTGEQALYDNTVDVVKVTSPGGQIKTLLFLTGCHPVNTDPTSGRFTATANYPGHAKRLIEEQTGAVNVIFLQGCAADINPKEPFKKSGEKLTGDVIRALNKKMTPIKGNVNFGNDSLKIPINPWSKDKVAAFKDESINGKLVDYLEERNVIWSDMMLDYYEKDAMPNDMTVYIQTFNIGDWKLVGLSREVTNEYGSAIRYLWPNKNVTVAAYTNDVSSYLPTDPHIQGKTYEGYDSFFWYGLPSPFPSGTFDMILKYIQTKNK